MTTSFVHRQPRIAVAGAGLIGKAHIAATLACPRVQLCAIVDPSPQTQALAEQAGVPQFSSLEALFASDKPDGVVLATPNQLHLAHAITCMDAGVPMLLEKPIAPTVQEAKAILAHQAQTQAVILIGHHRAHSPIMTKAREVVQSGQLGQLVAVMGSALFYKPDAYYEEGAWRKAPGGGPVLLNMIHEVHNMRLLCGEIAAVQAFASHRTRGFAVEDTVAINLQFESGVLGTFLLSDAAASAKSWELTSGENTAYPNHADEDCYVISGTRGTRGTLSVPTLRMTAYAADVPSSWWHALERSTHPIDRTDPIAQQMLHFSAVVRGETNPLVSARDGLRNLQVTEAILQAARTGQKVDVTER